MTPFDRYQEYLLNEGFYADPNQEKVVQQFQRVYLEFISAKEHKFQNWLNRTGLSKPTLIKGIYLWGSVGAGKTLLMDLFYDSLPVHKKRRWHFHKFMQQIHHDLKVLQGHANPLKEVAKRFAKKNIKIICLDEFLVTDITDAMLLANLLTALFAEGVTLVTTANVPPQDLYKNGLQRDRFLPAIALLQKNLQVIHLEAQRDYRLRPQKPVGNYFSPLDEYAVRAMQESFSHYAHYAGLAGEHIEIGGRMIPSIKRDHTVIWFDFREICSPPRSQLDYLEIAKRFSTVLVSNIPRIAAQEKNLASYFIKLVDVFYDARVRLIISAEVPIGELYPEGELAFQFKRTESRLIEMQGEEYTKKWGHEMSPL